MLTVAEQLIVSRGGINGDDVSCVDITQSITEVFRRFILIRGSIGALVVLAIWAPVRDLPLVSREALSNLISGHVLSLTVFIIILMSTRCRGSRCSGRRLGRMSSESDGNDGRRHGEE